MSNQPKALQLADWVDRFYRNVNDPEDFRWKHMVESATELRRLYALNHEMLEALQYLMVASGEQLTTAFEQAQEVITKATGEQSC